MARAILYASELEEFSCLLLCTRRLADHEMPPARFANTVTAIRDHKQLLDAIIRAHEFLTATMQHAKRHDWSRT